jgi:hypothetical protein
MSLFAIDRSRDELPVASRESALSIYSSESLATITADRIPMVKDIRYNAYLAI